MKSPIKVIQKNIPVEQIIKQYLLHEFSKLLNDVEDQKFWEQFERSLDFNLRKMPGNNLWQLLSGISEGYKLKWLYRILSDNSFVWNHELWFLEDITATRMDSKIDKIIRENSDNPIKFGQYVREHPEIKKLFFDLEGDRGFYRNKFPILLRQDGQSCKVLDGMRRICLAAINGRTEIEVIVGYKIKSGKMKVNPDKIYFLNLLYKESQNKPELKEPLRVILKEIEKQFRETKKIKESSSAEDIKEFFIRGVSLEEK